MFLKKNLVQLIDIYQMILDYKMKTLLLATTFLTLLATPAFTDILVDVDKTTQQMKVTVDDQPTYNWKISSGMPGHDTPDGNYIPPSMNEEWFSHEYGNVPMPHAIFIDKNGHAIHGFSDSKNLGKPVSHGCIRLSPENAATLYALVEDEGLDKTRVIVHGMIPTSQPQYQPPQQYQQQPYPEYQQPEQRYLQGYQPPPQRYYYRQPMVVCIGLFCFRIR